MGRQLNLISYGLGLARQRLKVRSHDPGRLRTWLQLDAPPERRFVNVQTKLADGFRKGHRYVKNHLIRADLGHGNALTCDAQFDANFGGERAFGSDLDHV